MKNTQIVAAKIPCLLPSNGYLLLTTNKVLPFWLLTVLVLAMQSTCWAQDEAPVVGPLVGEASPTGVSLWMHAAKDSNLEVEYAESGKKALKKVSLAPVDSFAAKKISGWPAKVTLTGLEPDTAYTFRVAVDGEFSPERSGTFRTAPEDGRPCQFRLGLTSCMKDGKPQKSWKLFQSEKPTLHLTLGDTQYCDSTNPDQQWKHHLRYRQTPEFAAVIRNMPTYAMWDDHDYGPNNSDGTASGKENSLASWRQVWGNPTSGTKETEGAFFRFSWGDVDFFVVDGRYHRSPDNAKDDDQKRMLGDPQFDWLLNGLKESKAKFKVIASGSTLNHSKVDGWRIYTFSRHRLFDAIAENKIAGVLYMSGDIHQSLVWEHPESDRVGYPLVEVISSGIANSKTLSFATIDFDTKAADPTVRVRIVYGDGSVKDDRTWNLSTLSPK